MCGTTPEAIPTNRNQHKRKTPGRNGRAFHIPKRGTVRKPECATQKVRFEYLSSAQGSRRSVSVAYSCKPNGNMTTTNPPAAQADPATGQIEMIFPDPAAAPEPEMHFPDGLRDWMRWTRSVDLSGVGTRRTQETARLILGELAASVRWDTDDDNYGKAWPSVDAIAATIKRSRRTICYVLRRLEQTGHVERIERRRPDGGFTSNLYALKPAKIRPKFLQGGICKNPAVFAGGDLQKPRSFCRSIEPKKELNPPNPHGRRIFDDSFPSLFDRQPQKAETKARAVQERSPEPVAHGQRVENARVWLRNRGVRAVSFAKVAETDPKHFGAVRAATEGNPDAGPGLVVDWLRKAKELPGTEGGQRRFPYGKEGYAAALAYLDRNPGMILENDPEGRGLIVKPKRTEAIR